jgi:hypothetical protein
MSVEVLYDYEYLDGFIYELKFNGIASQRKKYRYQWYMVYKGKQYKLRFVEMTKSTRTLNCAKFSKVFIDFDKDELTLSGYPEQKYSIISRK